MSSAGFIDAAWWARTRDLSIELPQLVDVLWTANRQVNRIIYNLHAWDPAPRRMPIEGRIVRLGGFATSDPNTVRLTDAWGQERIDILVIAAETEHDMAQRILDIASQPDGCDQPQVILDRASDTVIRDPDVRS